MGPKERIAYLKFGDLRDAQREAQSMPRRRSCKSAAGGLRLRWPFCEGGRGGGLLPALVPMPVYRILERVDCQMLRLVLRR